MATPTAGLHGFGLDACGIVEQQPSRSSNGARESFFACSTLPTGATCSTPTRKTTPRASDQNPAFVNASVDSKRYGRARAALSSSSESAAKKAARNGRTMERSHSQRSRSLQHTGNRAGRSSRRIPMVDLTIETKPSIEQKDFILPQYIGSQYDGKVKAFSSGKPRQDTDDDSTDSSHKRCYHVECLPHGCIWTILAILIPWAGLGLAVLSRQSLDFVRLEQPWHIDGLYDDITSLGVIHAGICYNETVSTIKDPTKVGCFKVPLATNDDLEDPIFKLAAVFASISVLMGCILTFSMSTTVIWRTINFRALGSGYLFVYCFQSLAFLFFDTDICENHECKVGIGCIYCIAASVCWISSCLLCAKMDSNRARKELAEERKRRKRRATKEALRKRSIIHSTGATVVTERTASTYDDELTLDFDEELALSSFRGGPTKPRQARHRSLSSSRSRDVYASTHTRGRQSSARDLSSRNSHSSPRHNRHRSLSSSRSRDVLVRTGRQSSLRDLSSSGRHSNRLASMSSSHTTEPLRKHEAPKQLKQAKSMAQQLTMQELSAGRARHPNHNQYITDMQSPRGRQLASGIAKQHEGIITLNAPNRYSTGQSTISALTATSMDNTLDNRNRGRVEFQGKVLPPRRGRGRSRSKSRQRAGNGGSPIGEKHQRVYRSRSRGRSTSNAPKARLGSKAKIAPLRPSAREFEAPASRKTQRKSHVRTRNGTYVDVPLTPPNFSPSQPPDVSHVTSYFAI